MLLLGLTITKEDQEVFGEWCQSHLFLYDAVVCLDSSGGELRWRHPVRQPTLSTSLGGVPDYVQHEPPRRLLRQPADGKPIGFAEEGTDSRR